MSPAAGIREVEDLGGGRYRAEVRRDVEIYGERLRRVHHLAFGKEPGACPQLVSIRVVEPGLAWDLVEWRVE